MECHAVDKAFMACGMKNKQGTIRRHFEVRCLGLLLTEDDLVRRNIRVVGFSLDLLHLTRAMRWDLRRRLMCLLCLSRDQV